MKRTFKKGDQILEEGTSGSEAYIIDSGKIQVFRTKKGKNIELAVLGQNQLFGEMSMVDDRPRSASVVALEDTVVTVIGPDEFNKLYNTDPTLLMFMLKNIFERLRHMDQAVIEAAVCRAAESYQEGKVLISALTPETREALGADKLMINKFPFKVGRKTENSSKDMFSNNDLYVKDAMPFNVSRNHFSIQAKLSKFFVIDRGSTLGTTVNDIRIGGPSSRSEIELEKGDNTLIVGSAESPYRFRVTIE